MENNMTQHVEALIFAAQQPIIFAEIQAAVSDSLETEVSHEAIEACIEAIRAKFLAPEHAFELTEMAGGYQLLTKADYHHTLAIHLKHTTRKRLSQTAMETLAIIAYRQPISKPEMEEIRGVSCDYAVQKLLEKELVAIAGRAETPGKPLLYGTTDKFMDYLGINSMDELPKPKDFKEVENTIGEVLEGDTVAVVPIQDGAETLEDEDVENENEAEIEVAETISQPSDEELETEEAEKEVFEEINSIKVEENEEQATENEEEALEDTDSEEE